MRLRKPSYPGARTVLFGGAFAALLAACSSPQASAPKAQSKPAPEAAAPKELPGVREGVDPEVARRTEELLAQMTLEEKIDYLGGERGFYIRPIERLGIPEIRMSDGPAGCRNWGPSTAYPAAVAVTAAFDRGLSERVGHAMGRDCRARGVHILLAPGVNIQRSPLNGRNFEYMGEDPYLAGQAAGSFIRGLQGEGVLGTVKHFAANNQEWDRNHVSSEVDERTLREIYFPAFETAVRDAKVGSVMTAYNLLNGTYASHDAWLLKQVLKEEWGFTGFVMSDWAAVHDTLGAVTGGLDLEMPSGAFMNRTKLLPLLALPEGASTNQGKLSPRAAGTKPSVADIDD
jgi:beta-glucosidase